MPKDNLDKLNEMLEEAKNKSGAEKQHKKGKLSVWERLDLLLDPNTFVQLDALVKSRFEDGKEKYLGDGVVAGFGKINGRQV